MQSTFRSLSFMLVIAQPGSLIRDEIYVKQKKFKQAVTEHREICSKQDSCIGSSSCCGSCTCGADCVTYGSCCLEMFQNFEQARKSIQNNRYDCVNPKYLPQEESDYNINDAFWMITKCDPEYQDQSEIDKCLRPSLDLEYHIPVTDIADRHVHFRNKHCAYCNFVDKNAPLVKWKLEIKTNDHISFPESNLLQKLRETRGNIIFTPLRYLTADVCKPTPHKLIDTCRMNGTWRETYEYVETACESFKDPFNFTYQNVFCYLCNQQTENVAVVKEILTKDTECLNQYTVGEIKKPAFTATLDFLYVRDGNMPENLICDVDEFPDYRLGVCRKIYCYDAGALYGGVCWQSSEKNNDIKTCFSVVLKLTPSRADDHVQLLTQVDKIALVASVTDTGFYDTSDNVIDDPDDHNFQERTDVESVIFSKTNTTGSVDFFVIYMVKEFTSNREKNKYLSGILSSFPMLFQDDEEQIHEFDVEVVDYDISLTNGGGTITISTLSDDSDVRRYEMISDLIYRPDDTYTCPYQKTVQLTKIHVCPYIELRTDEVVFDEVGGFLFFYGGNLTSEKPTAILSKWEYEIYDDFLYICLADYSDIYKRIPAFIGIFSKTDTARSEYSLYLELLLILFVGYLRDSI